jgi:hypothetical protein
MTLKGTPVVELPSQPWRSYIAGRWDCPRRCSPLRDQHRQAPIVDEQSLVDALSNDVIAAAGLDVYEREPDLHPGLRSLDNVVLLPHIGSAGTTTRDRMGMLAVDNVRAVLNGEAPLTPVTS